MKVLKKAQEAIFGRNNLFRNFGIKFDQNLWDFWNFLAAYNLCLNSLKNQQQFWTLLPVVGWWWLFGFSGHPMTGCGGFKSSCNLLFFWLNKPLSTAQSSAVNKTQQHQEKHSWERRESNPGLLVRKRERYLSVVILPSLIMICFKLFNINRKDITRGRGWGYFCCGREAGGAFLYRRFSDRVSSQPKICRDQLFFHSRIKLELVFQGILKKFGNFFLCSCAVESAAAIHA